MNAATFGPWVAAVLGGGTLGTLASGWLNRRKTAADAQKTGAEAHKVEAEADATRAATVQGLIDMLHAELDRYGARVSNLEQQTAQCEADRRADRALIEQLRAELASVRAELGIVKAVSAGTQERLNASQGDLR